jgi:predicted transcriptional regulator
MQLTIPTDLELLIELSDKKRNTAANLSDILDIDRAYINTELSSLEDYGLLNKVGPHPESGVYEITEKGLQVKAIAMASSKPVSDIDYESKIEETHLDE